MIEIEQNKQTKTYVISPIISGEVQTLAETSRLDEAKGLALAVNLDVVCAEIVHIREIKPATYFSRGVIERLQPVFAQQEIELLIVDTEISPIQQRNLERELKVKVIDRTALILEIFGERAQTKEGVLQVELAHLTYQRSRLVRSWTHLERQRGGAGFLGGPGETQIELDRRIIDDKIVRIKKDLEKVKQTRGIQRGARRKVPYPVVALVGYTNAGKSTLFNRLTKSNVMAEDMLFATLDPTMRKVLLPSGMEVIFSDTVGFISDLPHELVMAFRATLEEVLEADIILHVRDASNPDHASQRRDVLDVLENLGLKEIKYADNYFEVLNKADLLDEESRCHWQEKTLRHERQILISAQTGEGCTQLLQTIEKQLNATHNIYTVSMPTSEGKIAAWLYDNGQVQKLENNEDVNIYTVSMSADKFSRLQHLAKENNDINIRKTSCKNQNLPQ